MIVLSITAGILFKLGKYPDLIEKNKIATVEIKSWAALRLCINSDMVLCLVEPLILRFVWADETRSLLAQLYIKITVSCNSSGSLYFNALLRGLGHLQL